VWVRREASGRRHVGIVRLIGSAERERRRLA
jgi:hypothetical protein